MLRFVKKVNNAFSVGLPLPASLGGWLGGADSVFRNSGAGKLSRIFFFTGNPLLSGWVWVDFEFQDSSNSASAAYAHLHI